MNMKLRLLILLLALSAGARADVIAGGRTFDPEHSFSISLSMGQVTDISGGVQETTRRLFEVTGEPERQKGQVSYSFNELGLTESEIMYGVQLEKMWKYVTLRFDIASLSAEANGAPYRDVFLEVDEISFQGQKYTHQKLENNVPYHATLDGLMANAGFDLTPFTLNPDGVVQATPWLHLGVLGVLSDFEVDQGPATRLQVYENPPQTYVVGGHGSGQEGVVSPEFGLGGEVKVNFGQRLERPLSLALQGTYSIFNFSGDTGDLGIGAKTDKAVDLEYDAYELRARFEVPLTQGTDLLLGASYRVITVAATSKAKERSLEETLARREKFDKDITLDLTIMTAFIGLRW